MSIILGYDPTTLREKVDLVAAGERLDELGEQRNTAALNEKIGLLRLVGRTDRRPGGRLVRAHPGDAT